MNTVTQTDTRTEYIAGLRVIADALETHPDMDVPWTGGPVSEWSQYCHSREEMAAWVALLDDAVDHGVLRSGSNDWYEISGRVRGVRVILRADTKYLGGARVVREVESFEVEPFLPQSVSA